MASMSPSYSPEESTCPTVVNSKSPSQVDLEKNIDSQIPFQLEVPDADVKALVSRVDRLKLWLLLPLLCSAQFFDIFASSSALVALPEVRLSAHNRKHSYSAD